VPVSAQETVFQHVGNGVTVSFPYGCQVAQASDLKVYLNDVEVATGYTVSGIGVPTGGAVTFDAPPSNLSQVRLERDIVLERLTDYQQNGDFLARVVNPDFNRLWMALQQHLAMFRRAILIPKSETTGIKPLPNIADRANKLLSFDASGNPVAVAPAAQSATALQILLATSFGSTLVGFLQSGVGAVMRTLQEKTRDHISAFDFMSAVQIADVRSGAVTVDVTAALQAALNAAAGKTLLIPPGTYRCSASVQVKGNVEGWGATLKFYAAGIPYLVTQSVQASMRGFTIDGANVPVCKNGLFVDTDFVQTETCYYDLTIKNIRNTDNTQDCNGALFYKASSAAINLNSRLDIKIDVFGVTATANGIIGDNGGACTGILVSFNGPGCDSNVIVRDSTIKDISSGGADGAEDSNGVHLYTGDHTLTTSRGEFIVRNVKVYNAKKRGFKVQAANTVIENCVCYGQDTRAGFETYAIRTTFHNCAYLLGTYSGFTTTAPHTTIENCRGQSSGLFDLARFYAGSHHAVVRGLLLETTANFPSSDYCVMGFDGSENSSFSGVKIYGSTNTGAAVIVRNSTNTLAFDKLHSSGMLTGFLLAYSSGKLVMRDSEIVVASYGFHRLGNTDNPIVVHDSTIIANGIGFYTESSAGTNKATVDADNVKVFSNSHGALVPHGSRFVSTEFTSTGVTGYGILCGNSIVRGCRITKYGTGIGIAFSTTAEVSDNVTIGTVLPYETTGFTAFVYSNNSSR